MAKIYKQITDLIGKTPLVELGKYSASKGLETPVICQLIQYKQFIKALIFYLIFDFLQVIFLRVIIIE